MKIGAFLVVPLFEGRVKRDGGVSFGALTRKDWSKISKPDSDNCVSFGLCFFLLQGKGLNILVDCGVGDKRDAAQEKRDGIERNTTMEALLDSVGLKVEDIDIVILTHLHSENAGGLTKHSMDDDGSVEPTFPKARIVIQNGEWENAIHTNLRTRALYNKEDFEVLLWHQKLELIDGDTQLLPGLWVRVTGGHTNKHQVVVIESESEGAIFWGGLIPSTFHIDLNITSSLDIFPLQTMEMKAEWLKCALENQWVSFFSHDPEIAAGLIQGKLRGTRPMQVEKLIAYEDQAG